MENFHIPCQVSPGHQLSTSSGKPRSWAPHECSRLSLLPLALLAARLLSPALQHWHRSCIDATSTIRGTPAACIDLTSRHEMEVLDFKVRLCVSLVSKLHSHSPAIHTVRYCDCKSTFAWWLLDILQHAEKSLASVGESLDSKHSKISSADQNPSPSLSREANARRAASKKRGMFCCCRTAQSIWDAASCPLYTSPVWAVSSWSRRASASLTSIL